MTELLNAQWSGVLNPDELGLNGYGGRNPLFLDALGSNFTRRLGGNASDFFYSGTFAYDELTIGYIRIPTYSPTSTAAALTQFEREIAFFNANTDGLIVDEMRNPGGHPVLRREHCRAPDSGLLPRHRFPPAAFLEPHLRLLQRLDQRQGCRAPPNR